MKAVVVQYILFRHSVEWGLRTQLGFIQALPFHMNMMLSQSCRMRSPQQKRSRAAHVWQGFLRSCGAVPSEEQWLSEELCSVSVFTFPFPLNSRHQYLSEGQSTLYDKQHNHRGSGNKWEDTSKTLSCKSKATRFVLWGSVIGPRSSREWMQVIWSACTPACSGGDQDLLCF